MSASTQHSSPPLRVHARGAPGKAEPAGPGTAAGRVDWSTASPQRVAALLAEGSADDWSHLVEQLEVVLGAARDVLTRRAAFAQVPPGTMAAALRLLAGSGPAATPRSSSEGADERVSAAW